MTDAHFMDLDAVDRLRDRVSGVVLVRGDDGIADEVACFNVAVSHDPQLVVGVASEQDVVEAVRFAAEHELPVAVHSTGHGAYRPIASGLVIATRRLNTLSVDPGTRLARIGAGLRWSAVIDAAAPYGLAPVTGSSPTVGAVGYALGGGIGPLNRSHGMTSDWIRGFRVVTGSGELVTANADEHADLFWALRGGKVGLGVVTEMTLELAELPTLYGGGLFYDGSDDIRAALNAWIRWLPSLPENATTSVALLRLPDLPMLPPPLRGRTLLHVRFAYPGDETEGARLLQPMRDVLPPYLDTVEQIPATAMGNIHNDPHDPSPSWTHGVMLTDFDHDLAALLLDRLGPDVDSPFLAVEVRGIGGKLGVDHPSGTAAGGREAAFILTLIAVGPVAFQPHIPQAVADNVFRAASAWLAPVTNINFAGDPTLPETLAIAWRPDMAERLATVRASYDPRGVLLR
ncbi:MAG TPA: FAD-binding oxidoreductase [Humibacter sp.]|nr:FAD-binding oxidoreductase [Humibacter sp.]